MTKCSEALDVAVIGAGPAGCVAAIILARNGFRVGLFTQNKSTRTPLGEHLPPRSVKLMERLGLRDAISGHPPIYGLRSSWDSGELIERSYLTECYGDGLLLDRNKFDKALLQVAVASGVLPFADQTFIECQNDGDQWKLGFCNQRGLCLDVQATFCVEATGRERAFARKQGVEVKQFDRLTAVSQLFEGNRDGDRLNHEILIEAAEHGWLYSAPLRKGQQLCTFFSDDRETLKALVSNDCVNLSQQGTHTKLRFTSHSPVAPPTARPASTTKLATACGSNWLAVGDAAMTFDPLSSHGIATAITTGYYGANAVNDLLHGNLDAQLGYSAIVEQILSQVLSQLGELYSSANLPPKAGFWFHRSETVHKICTQQ